MKKKPSPYLIPNLQLVDYSDETQKGLLIEIHPHNNEYDSKVDPNTLKTDSQEEDLSDEIYNNFTSISKLSTDLETGEIIIQTSPHTGKPILTQILDNYPQTICLHNGTKEEDLKEIYKDIISNYNINVN